MTRLMEAIPSCSHVCCMDTGSTLLAGISVVLFGWVHEDDGGCLRRSDVEAMRLLTSLASWLMMRMLKIAR